MPTLSPRETFDRNLKQLLDEVLVMGSMVEQAVLDSIDALKRRDVAAAQRIYHGDQRINEKRYAIEHNCLIQIATQQPMARDLRTLAAVLEIITELERIGDYAKGISHITVMIGDYPSPKQISEIEQMANTGLNMLHRALGAFVSHDYQTARAIPVEDDIVDALYNQVYRELIDRMIANPAEIDNANYLVWAAHNLERLADRVTNICERIIFVETGEMRELDVSDDERIKRKYHD
jgi:phosphate transport system protein